MMDKKQFLWELERSLSVLQEDELKDIIGEYEQHIDIKVEKGLTEEEAIEDFGSLEELTAEILEAYHVRVDYAVKTGGSRKKPGIDPGQDRGENFEKLKEIGKRGSLTLWDGMKKAGGWIAGAVRWGWRQMCRPFAWIGSFTAAHNSRHEAPAEALGEKGESERDSRGREKNGGRAYIQRKRQDEKMTEKAIMGSRKGIRAMGKGIGRVFQWVMEGALWTIRLAWNVCWVMFSLFTGGLGLFSLFGLGLLAVLLIEGYPLAGVLVGCVGLVFCLFSAAGLGMTLLWRKNTEGMMERTELEEKRGYNPEDRRRRIYKPGYTPKPKTKEETGQTVKADEPQGKEEKANA